MTKQTKACGGPVKTDQPEGPEAEQGAQAPGRNGKASKCHWRAKAANKSGRQERIKGRKPLSFRAEGRLEQG